MEFVAATNNKNKLREMRQILEAAGHTVISQQEAGVFLEPEEDGETFADNSLIKARAVCAACQKPTIGDDSGLVVDALSGGPGVHSARFAGPSSSDEQNNQKLLSLLERTPYAARTARFVCVVTLAMPDGSGMQVEGNCEGRIGFSKSGENGFGYDPLFYIGERSFAEIPAEEKNKISHRAAALRRLVAELPAFMAKRG